MNKCLPSGRAGKPAYRVHMVTKLPRPAWIRDRERKAGEREARRAELLKVRAWMDRLYGYVPASWAVHTLGLARSSVSNALRRGEVRREALSLPDGHVLTVVSIQDIAKLRPRKPLPAVQIPEPRHPQAVGKVWTAEDMIKAGHTEAEAQTPGAPTPTPTPAAKPPRRDTQKRSKGRGVARSTPKGRTAQRGSNARTPDPGANAPRTGGRNDDACDRDRGRVAQGSALRTPGS